MDMGLQLTWALLWRKTRGGWNLWLRRPASLPSTGISGWSSWPGVTAAGGCTTAGLGTAGSRSGLERGT